MTSNLTFISERRCLISLDDRLRQRRRQSVHACMQTNNIIPEKTIMLSAGEEEKEEAEKEERIKSRRDLLLLLESESRFHVIS